MSYLNCPRIHFGGAFYSNPSNLNNLVVNYDPSKPLEYNTGLYKFPDGVAQFWLEGCEVLSVVGADGLPVSSSDDDALIGAAVESAAPETPQTDPDGGVYDIGKMADLDPEMQFRTEIYGLRIFVNIRGGGGFSGLMGVPQLRDLYFLRTNAGVDGLQVAVGTWHQRLTEVVWKKPQGSSPVFELLRKEAVDGLDVKCSVDMYQTKRANKFTEGDMFGYGRLMGTFGPATAQEPEQIVPGRRMYAPILFQSARSSQLDQAVASDTSPEAPPVASWQVMEEMLEARARLEKTGLDTKSAGSVELASMDAGAAPLPWNATDFRVQALGGGRTMLIIDFGGTTPLAQDLQGRFDLGEDLLFGHEPNGSFVPFANQGYRNASGQLVTVNQQLADYAAGLQAAKSKRNSVWLNNSGVIQIELGSREAAAIADAGVFVRSTPTGGQPVERLRENSEGFYINVDQASIRLEPESKDAVALTVYRFGKPQSRAPRMTFSVTRSQASGSGSDPVGVKLASSPAPYPGRFPLMVKTDAAVPLTPERKPMDTLLFLINGSSTSRSGGKVVIGEGLPRFGPPVPLLSLLFWQNHMVVANANWPDHVGPILGNYARLYPGMKGRMDIGDETTVRAFAKLFKERFLVDLEDPTFMPVVRDMSPSMIRMIVDWLNRQTAAQTPGKGRR